MNGKIVAGFIVGTSAIAGAAIYYAQVFGYYHELPVSLDGVGDVQLVSVVSDLPEPIIYDNFSAIDASSSPIRYRACFTTTSSHAMLTETYHLVDGAEPRQGPGWFDCFDAAAIAAELEAGTALAFLGQKNISFGVDRIVAITEDGRGYVWHDLNECGAKAYDGTVVGEECPARPQGTE